jgi:hypothetical protein
MAATVTTGAKRSVSVLIPDVQVALDRKHPALHPVHLPRIAFAVGLGRRHLDAGLHAGRHIAELLIEPIDDLARPLEVGQRVAPGGRVEHATTRIAQGIVEGHNARHGRKWEVTSRGGTRRKIAGGPTRPAAESH